MKECKIVVFPKEQTLSRTQAADLFRQECVIFDKDTTYDGIPLVRVAELLGEEPAQFASNLDERNINEYRGCFGVGTYQCPYLTWKGFLKAVTYANVMAIAQKYPDHGSLDTCTIKKKGMTRS